MKIKSIDQLLAEKKRIKQEQHELEESIARNWEELKIQLKPSNLAKDAISSAIKDRIYNNGKSTGLFKTAIKDALTMLARKVTGKDEENKK
jgi:hypothetical protein